MQNDEEEEEEDDEVVEVEDTEPKMSVQEILNTTEFAQKMKEISEQNEQNKQCGGLEKLRKARILQQSPYQLQNELMNDKYQCQTPLLLKQYFAAKEELKKKQ